MPSPVPGLRSPYEKVGGLYAFGRTLDKARLFAAGQLPPDYHPFLGAAKAQTLDGRICRFLYVPYEKLVEQVKAKHSDEEILAWAFAEGRKPSAEEIEVFNGFLSKRGWRDETSSYLRQILVKNGFEPDAALTFFDNMDIDECRPLRFSADPAPPAKPLRGTATIPGLRSPYEVVGGIVHFGRMLDKIRLHRAGQLPPGWVDSMGSETGFDGICCHFLNIDYATLQKEALRGDSDQALLEWAFAHGRKPDEEEVLIFNGFLSKRGWRDDRTERLHFRLKESGLPVGAVLTMFDFIDLDENRPPRFSREI